MSMLVSSFLLTKKGRVSYDDGMKDGGNAINNGHEDIADGTEDALDTADYGTHCEVCVCVGVVWWIVEISCGEECSFDC